MKFYRWERILVPTDLSSRSGAAVKYAHALAERVGAELHVLHVVKSMDELAEQHGVAGVIDPSSPNQSSNWMKTLLGEPGEFKRVEAVRLSQDPDEAIVKYVRDKTVDLVVISTHGRSGLSHWLHGSVTESVIKDSACPVLVIRE